jgi:orotate phosphoribosyltransferase-like protein
MHHKWEAITLFGKRMKLISMVVGSFLKQHSKHRVTLYTVG